MTERIHNFNAGPAALPIQVLERIREELLNFQGTGMSVLEISHRSAVFERALNETVARLRRLMRLPDDYQVLFLQGGASTQFYMVPMNFLSAGDVADYVDTGTWAAKAMKEAKLLGHQVHLAGSSEDRKYSYIPENINFSRDAVYVHLTSNNTIEGTQWPEFPSTGGVPLVVDMSSDALCRPVEVKPFGLIYAGAQKNLGPAGVTLVIIRQDMLDRVKVNLPSMVSYQSHAAKNSMYNTPPVFAVYVVGLVLQWIEETIGGLEAMERINREKAARLYEALDSHNFYRPLVEKKSRSLMNVTFRLPTVDLEKEFVSEALAEGLGGVKGHRSVGGCRVSLYNAVTLEAVRDLTGFMKEFVRRRG
ncbi:MAG: 3-phosphoserine/phosphohydroxythreonine transaminase [Thermodesulfobacteriota bacterium]